MKKMPSNSSNMAADEEDVYYLEEASLLNDSDEEQSFDEVQLFDDISSTGDDEDLDFMKRKIDDHVRTKKLESFGEVVNESSSVAEIKEKAKYFEVVEDFVRNFLVRRNMKTTLETFQREWYSLKQNGELIEDDPLKVPDVYSKNQQLEELLKAKSEEVDYYKDIAKEAKDVHIRLKKERDHHKMHHKRITQEKAKLISEIKRIKDHYSSYEPVLKEWKQKYETAMKEKMLAKLEQDRALGQIQGLEDSLYRSQLLPHEGEGGESIKSEHNRNIKQKISPSKANSHHPKDTAFPLPRQLDTKSTNSSIPCPHLTRSGGFKLSHTFDAHSMAISGLSLHPEQPILATVSDDQTWSCWELPSGTPLMSGSGHTNWLSSCSFSPKGTHLATSSSDTTVKIWSFEEGVCSTTLSDHTHVVWACAFHSDGDFIASCSMDTTTKIWDLNSERCRHTLRGHSDSVNNLVFLPLSNVICTCSADKAVSLWDMRTGLCVETLNGHMHSINSVAFNIKGDTVASCDSYGILKLWDVRQMSVLTTVNVGPHPANDVAFDPSGAVIAVSSNDFTVKIYDIEKETVTALLGHEDSIQANVFDRNNEYLITAGSDSTVRLWS